MGILDGLIGPMQKLIDDTREMVKKRDEQQWEYLSVWQDNLNGLVASLGSDGAARWELVQVLRTHQGSPDGVLAIFKRPKLEDSDV